MSTPQVVSGFLKAHYPCLLITGEPKKPFLLFNYEGNYSAAPTTVSALRDKIKLIAKFNELVLLAFMVTLVVIPFLSFIVPFAFFLLVFFMAIYLFFQEVSSECQNLIQMQEGLKGADSNALKAERLLTASRQTLGNSWRGGLVEESILNGTKEVINELGLLFRDFSLSELEAGILARRVRLEELINKLSKWGGRETVSK